MGEVAVGAWGAEERKAGARGKAVGQRRGGSGETWEIFPPQVGVRVLLVEADDATRQIIAALLRKCSYTVAAAADGLKAWETLKEKSQHIDLVLTEVDLPSMSGYGLLTMIMKHETCKNIPVIMMSSHDSINTVFKCMLKGAADFLIKPIRKNELTNLWQHVWRRQSSDGIPRGTYEHQDENVTQQKSDANSENNSATNHSTDSIVSLNKNKGCSGKGCDTQSSCMRPDMDAESAQTQSIQDNIQSDCISSSVANDMKNHKDDASDKLDEKSCMLETKTEGCMGDAKIQPEVKNQKNCENKPSQEVDLIGALDKHSCCSHELENCSEIQCDVSNDGEILDDVKDQNCKPLLELTLGSQQSVSTDNREKDEFNMLNHSNLSAFSRYNRAVTSYPSTSQGFRTELVNYVSDAYLPSRDQGLLHGSTSQCNAAPLNVCPGDVDSPVGGVHYQCGIVPCSQLGLLPVPVPLSGTHYGPFSSYSPVILPLFCTESDTPVSSKPANNEATNSSLSCQSDRETPSQQCSGNHGQSVQKCFYRTQKEGMCNNESSKEKSHVSSDSSQSKSCTLNCCGSQGNSSGCGGTCDGRNGNSMSANAFRRGHESADGNGLHEIKLADFNRSTQREAALIKFRLKRKERCYEKKIRYQSRKKLAEERPRVKGQFVPQVQRDPGPKATV